MTQLPTTHTQSQHRLAVIVAFALVYFFWGSTYLGIDIAVEQIPPALMCGIRFLIAGGLTALASTRVLGANDTLRVDEKCRARVHAAFVIEDAVRFADRAMWPVIGEQRKRNAAELLSPRFQAGYSVCADLQDFHIEIFELFEVRTEPADLVLSSAGKCERQKGHHGATPAKAAQSERFTVMRSERKFRCLGSCLKSGHAGSP